MSFHDMARLRGTSQYCYINLKDSICHSLVVTAFECSCKARLRYSLPDTKAQALKALKRMAVAVFTPSSSNTWKTVDPKAEEIFEKQLRMMGIQEGNGKGCFINEYITKNSYRGMQWKNDMKNGTSWHPDYQPSSAQYPFFDVECHSWAFIAYIIIFIGVRCGEQSFYDICSAAILAYGLIEGLQRLSHVFNFAINMRYRVISLTAGTGSQGLCVSGAHFVNFLCHLVQFDFNIDENGQYDGIKLQELEDGENFEIARVAFEQFKLDCFC